MSRLAILLGSGNAALAIILGAFAAHALENSLSERMISIFNTAVDYHLYHALGLVVVGIIIKQQHLPHKALHLAIYLMLIGIIIFCGSLYALALSGVTKLGMITPIGGISFIAAWISVLISIAARNAKQ